eukprot:11398678-Ditylum_brightwellii.AAC.1
MSQMRKLKAWEVINLDEVPCTSDRNRHTVIESTWAFKVKQAPDSSVKKQKARLCIRGDQQVKNVDYFEIYAPVVLWNTVFTVMTLAVNLGLQSRQVDYTNAFVQATLPSGEEVYMSLPRGYEEPGKVLKLTKTVYGLAQVLLAWFTMLKQGLEATGFKPSDMDPCLFISDMVICVVYMDNCLMFSRNLEDIDQAIQAMMDKGFELRIEDDAAGFLGIKLERQDDGSIELKQSALIQHIIETVGFQNATAKYTPAKLIELPADKNGLGPQEAWSCSSVIGMLMYLASNSRPDIAMAVHQCARYSHNPRRSHEKAVKRIIHYLIGTKDTKAGRTGFQGM